VNVIVILIENPFDVFRGKKKKKVTGLTGMDVLLSYAHFLLKGLYLLIAFVECVLLSESIVLPFPNAERLRYASDFFFLLLVQLSFRRFQPSLFLCVCVCVCVCVCMHVYVCVCICMCIHIFILTACRRSKQ
jgi:hypothetical protein